MTTKLLDKFFRGECDDKELSMVLSWINSNDVDKDMANLFTSYFNDFPKEEFNVVDNQEVDRIKRELNLRIKHRLERKNPPNPSADNKAKFTVYHSNDHKARWKNLIRASVKFAAIFLIVLSGTFFLHHYFSKGTTIGGDQPETSQWVNKSNNKHQISKLLLQDGSIVTLNKLSQLWVDKDYSETNRKVFLSGEAFFEVKSNEGHPFTVVCQNMEVTAKGTSFNIKQNEMELTQVSLVNGKVEVLLKASLLDRLTPRKEEVEPVLLRPGQSLILSDQSGTGHEIVDFDYLDLVGWKDGILYFKDADLAQVIEKLEKWYMVEITVSGKPQKTWRYTGQFKDETLQNVLDGLTYTSKFKFTISQNKVDLEF